MEEDTRKCSICGNMIKPKKVWHLYGIQVCKSHVTALANLRGIAYLIDLIIWILIATIFAEFFFGTPPDGITRQQLAQGLMFLGWPIFGIKDGFWGRSPGKFICGLVTINSSTKKPIGIGASFLRNLPLAIPFLPLLVAFQLKGARIGDGWSSARVIRNKDKKLFASFEGTL